jgi:succinate dehydrogenase / fumarate reductase, membrane anchor subunit
MNAQASQVRAGRHGKGVHHWWVQRLTAVALIPVTVWFVVSMLALPAHDYATVVAWLNQKWTAVLLALLIALTAWHSQLGVQVVLEDYVRDPARSVATLLSRLAHTVVTVVAIYALLRVGFGSVA